MKETITFLLAKASNILNEAIDGFLNKDVEVRGKIDKVNEELRAIPSVKAIPIEWIKKQKVDFQNEDYPFNYTRGVQDGYNDCIDYLIDEWEEENK